MEHSLTGDLCHDRSTTQLMKVGVSVDLGHALLFRHVIELILYVCMLFPFKSKCYQKKKGIGVDSRPNFSFKAKCKQTGNQQERTV